MHLLIGQNGSGHPRHRFPLLLGRGRHRHHNPRTLDIQPYILLRNQLHPLQIGQRLKLLPHQTRFRRRDRNLFRNIRNPRRRRIEFQLEELEPPRGRIHEEEDDVDGIPDGTHIVRGLGLRLGCGGCGGGCIGGHVECDCVVVSVGGGGGSCGGGCCGCGGCGGSGGD